jgi:hypothetical protein
MNCRALKKLQNERLENHVRSKFAELLRKNENFGSPSPLQKALGLMIRQLKNKLF